MRSSLWAGISAALLFSANFQGIQAADKDSCKVAAVAYASNSLAKANFSKADYIFFDEMPVGRVFFDCRKGLEVTATVRSPDLLPNSAWYTLAASAANALTSDYHADATAGAKRCFVELARAGGWSFTVDTERSRMTCSTAGDNTEIVIRRLPKT